MIQFILIVVFVIGGMASAVWYGAREPNQNLGQKRFFGLFALASWLTLAIFAGVVL